MELTFKKINEQWVAEFEATSNFNINLDRVGKGALTIYLKGSKDGTYASQASYRNTKDSENVDADITALVYPKYIKVVSQPEVVKGIVTMEGEGGGSGSGGGLRPITADDVSLFAEDMRFGSIEPISFSTIVTLNQQNLIVRSNKKLYTSIENKPDTVEGGELRYYGDHQSAKEVVIDLYVKD